MKLNRMTFQWLATLAAKQTFAASPDADTGQELFVMRTQLPLPTSIHWQQGPDTEVRNAT